MDLSVLVPFGLLTAFVLMIFAFRKLGLPALKLVSHYHHVKDMNCKTTLFAIMLSPALPVAFAIFFAMFQNNWPQSLQFSFTSNLQTVFTVYLVVMMVLACRVFSEHYLNNKIQIDLLKKVEPMQNLVNSEEDQGGNGFLNQRFQSPIQTLKRGCSSSQQTLTK